MNATKRIFGIFLALAILLSLCPTAFAQPAGSSAAEVQGEGTTLTEYEGHGSIHIKSVGNADASKKWFHAYKLLDLKLYMNGTEVVVRQYNVPSIYVDFYAERYGLDSNVLGFANKVAECIQKDDVNLLLGDMAELIEFPWTGKAVEDGYEFPSMPLGMYLIEDRTGSAENAGPAYPLTLAITDPHAVIEDVVFEETEATDCLRFDFDTEEYPVTDWVLSRYTEVDLTTGKEPPLYTEDGYLVAHNVFLGFTYFDYVGDLDYIIKPTDLIEMSFVLEGYNDKHVSITADIVVDGVKHSISVASFMNEKVRDTYATEPLGLSGRVDSISFNIFGFEQQIDRFKLDYLFVGTGMASDPGNACIEILNVNQANERLNASKFSITGEGLETVKVNRNEYKRVSDGKYWKLVDGSYTTVDPDSVIDGMPVDKSRYVDVYTRYSKYSVLTTEDCSETNSVTATVGVDGFLGFRGLRAGTYTIKQVEGAPDSGIMTEEITVCITWNPLTLEYEYEGAVYENKAGHLTVVNYEFPKGGVDESLRMYFSLDLASDISLNYVVPVSCLEGYDMDTVYLEVWIPLYEGNSDVVSAYTVRLLPELRGAYYYFTLKGLTAVQINDYIGATLYGTKDHTVYESEGITYSVATYALSQLNKSNTSKELKTICANLLRYGSLAQQYKVYRTYDLADEAMTAEHKAYLTDLSSVTFANNYLEIGAPESPSFLWNGKGLDLDTRVGIVLRVQKLDQTFPDDNWKLVVRYRNKDDEQISYEIPADKAENVEDLYTFTLSCLDASELRNILAVAVCDAAGQSPFPALIDIGYV